jgi:acyl carrier protein
VYAVRRGERGGEEGEGVDEAGESVEVIGVVEGGGRREWVSKEELVKDLREYLGGRLPEYMVPGSYRVIGEMPLTGNGKKDRRRLEQQAEAEDVAGERIEDGHMGRSPVEDILAGIWSNVLQVKGVGVQDNFFDLGGHSLLATQVTAGIRDIFHVEIPLRSIFEKPTVAGLSKKIEEALKTEQEKSAPPIKKIARDEPPPLSFAQQRLWFLDQLAPGSPLYNCPIALRLTGNLNVQALEQMLNEMVSRHEILRTTFAAVDGSPVQVIAPSLSIELPVTDLRERPDSEREAEAKRLAYSEARKPFDLAQGPLLRASLVRLSDGEYVALFTMHHIICDGWSLGVFVEEVAALYKAFCEGKGSPLPELPIQYADYAHWQREWVKGDLLETQLSYWRNQLEGAPALLKLPIDRARPPVQEFIGAPHPFALSKPLTDQIKDLSRQQGVTVFMTLLAAFKTLLHYYSGEEDIVVGTPIANRNRVEVERLIGFFVNTVVLRTRLDGDLTFEELLSRVRDVALGAYAHQDMPFDEVVRHLKPERHLSHTPFFQVTVNFMNTPIGVLELPGLTLNYLDLEDDIARFNLMLDLWDSPDGVKGILRYDVSLFYADTVARMVSNWKTILEAAALNPAAKLKALTERLAEEESQRRAAERNRLEASSIKRLKNIDRKIIKGPRSDKEDRQ